MKSDFYLKMYIEKKYFFSNKMFHVILNFKIFQTFIEKIISFNKIILTL